MRSKIGAGERDEQAARVYGSTFTVLPCWFWRRSRGWARNYGAAGETRKTKFAKRTWNVSWNQQINFLVRFTDAVAEARTHRKKRDACATRG